MVGKTKISSQHTRLLGSVILTFIIVSFFWAYIRTQQQHQHASIISTRDAQINSLQQQIEQQSRINQQLVENFSLIQEQRLHAETRLANVETKLTTTEEALSALNEMDWKSKYELAMIDNEQLVEKIAELEFQNAEQIDGLIEERAYINNKHDADIQHLELANQTLLEDLDNKESEYEQQKEHITQLQSENAEYKQSLIKLDAKIKQLSKVETDKLKTKQQPASNSTKNNYRSSRLRSLGTAMVDRNSTERKNILISVIPTIPKGISGDELLQLVHDMESKDILAVIQTSNQHIIRPMNHETLQILSKNMSKQDADLASNLLADE